MSGRGVNCMGGIIIHELGGIRGDDDLGDDLGDPEGPPECIFTEDTEDVSDDEDSLIEGVEENGAGGA